MNVYIISQTNNCINTITTSYTPLLRTFLVRIKLQIKSLLIIKSKDHWRLNLIHIRITKLVEYNIEELEVEANLQHPSKWRQLHIPNFKLVSILDNNVVHVHGPELGEVPGERDEMNGGSLVVLQKLRVIIVPLPSQRQQLPF